jgi:hypothetical protein
MVREMQRTDELVLFLVARSLKHETEQHRRAASATGFGLQADWNRSNRCACARSGARLMWKKKRGKSFVSRLSFQIVVK